MMKTGLSVAPIFVYQGAVAPLVPAWNVFIFLWFSALLQHVSLGSKPVQLLISENILVIHASIGCAMSQKIMLFLSFHMFQHIDASV